MLLMLIVADAKLLIEHITIALTLYVLFFIQADVGEPLVRLLQTDFAVGRAMHSSCQHSTITAVKSFTVSKPIDSHAFRKLSFESSGSRIFSTTTAWYI